MIPLIHELAQRALSSAVASMSTSLLALSFPIIFGIYKIIASYKRDRWMGVKKHFSSNVWESVIFGVCWWAILFLFYFCIRVPQSIRKEADQQPPPPPLTQLQPKPPQSAFVLVDIPVPKIVSFVFACCTLVLNNDSWDFTLKHRGNAPVESIDVMFQDVNRLHAIRRNTPPNTIVSPSEFSLFFHIDKMYPKGLGSLFAKQFVWKPDSLGHGHYSLDISASTGRFHEDLFIEKTDLGYTNAAVVTDIDTKEVLFKCRDRDFPKNIAAEVVAKKNCFPDWIKE